MHIVIAGNIGSGKSTLTRLLSQHYGWTPRYESVDHNPYLEDYYRDIHRWSFNLEVYFLKERFRDMLAIAQTPGTIIQDRSIFEGVYVFMANNKAMGHLSDRDYRTYMELFEQMLSIIKLPDLMIYLRASVSHLVNNIQKRGRDYEQTMRLDYLEGLNKRYEDWIADYKGNLVIINGDEVKFGDRPEDFQQVCDKIDANLYGIFSPFNQQR